MTEQRTPYEVEDSTENALAMLGSGYSSVEISPSEKRLVRIDGEFREVEKAATVTISTAFKKEMENVSGDALKVWLYISLSINKTTERANPGLRTIAKACHLAVNTVQKCLSELEEMKLLLVNRETARYNIYEVPLYVSANRKPPTVSQNDTVEQTVSNLPETVSNSEQTVSPAVILNHLTINQVDEKSSFSEKKRKPQKKGDLVDGLLFFSQKAKGEDEVEEMLVRLEKSLNVNLSRSLSNQTFAKKIIKAGKDGQELGVFLSWLKNDEWRQAHLYIYADLSKIWQIWPQAFVEVKTIEYPKVVAHEDDEKGVPNPFGRPKGVRPVVRQNRTGSQSIAE